MFEWACKRGKLSGLRSCWVVWKKRKKRHSDRLSVERGEERREGEEMRVSKIKNWAILGNQKWTNYIGGADGHCKS